LANLNAYVRKPYILLQGKSALVKLKLLLVCDLAALCKLYGFAQITSHQCSFMCPWCHAKRGDWKEKIALLRNLDTIAKDATKATEYAHENGVYDAPLIKIPLENVIVCNLHMFMSIVKVTLRHTLFKTYEDSTLSTKEEQVILFFRSLASQFAQVTQTFGRINKPLWKNASGIPKLAGMNSSCFCRTGAQLLNSWD
jgi:glutaredoxin